MTFSNRFHLACYALLLFASSGCGGPDALPLPSYDPSGSAAKAMELYDGNGDGFVDSEELEKAPGLKAALKNLDSDGDGKVSEAEVAERVKSWDAARVGIMTFDAHFLLDGKPLGKANVVFEPDEMMLGAVQASNGTTDLGGRITPKVPKEKRPTPESPPGMQAGIYVVRVTNASGGKTIPARYNVETELGQEIALDDDNIFNQRVVFRLKSK